MTVSGLPRVFSRSAACHPFNHKSQKLNTEVSICTTHVLQQTNRVTSLFLTPCSSLHKCFLKPPTVASISFAFHCTNLVTNLSGQQNKTTKNMGQIVEKIFVDSKAFACCVEVYSVWPRSYSSAPGSAFNAHLVLSWPVVKTIPLITLTYKWIKSNTFGTPRPGAIGQHLRFVEKPMAGRERDKPPNWSSSIHLANKSNYYSPWSSQRFPSSCPHGWSPSPVLSQRLWTRGLAATGLHITTSNNLSCHLWGFSLMTGIDDWKSPSPWEISSSQQPHLTIKDIPWLWSWVQFRQNLAIEAKVVRIIMQEE